MSNDALLALQALFVEIWKLCTSFRIPGTNISPVQWAMFSLFFVFIIKTIKRFLSNDSNAGDK